MAEAPSLRISTRSMAPSGIEFRSTALPLAPCVATRRPFSSTSVLLAPRPRRLALLLPLLLRSVVPSWMPTLDDRLSAPVPLALMCISSCSALTKPARSICSRVTVCTGSAPSVWMRLMLEPVMVTRCSAVCAKACVARPSSARLPIRSLSFIDGPSLGAAGLAAIGVFAIFGGTP